MLWVLWVHTHQGYIHTTGNDGDNSDNATYLYLCNDDDRDDGSSRPMSAYLHDDNNNDTTFSYSCSCTQTMVVTMALHLHLHLHDDNGDGDTCPSPITASINV